MPFIYGNRYLTHSEMENNARIVYSFFTGKGWTINAIAAMLGNMQSESSINPGIWEGLKPFQGGYGLVQWTPYTKYSEWAGTGWENNGSKQMQRIIFELETGIQYYPTSKYPETFREFTQSEKPVQYLAYAWMYNYERPDNLDQPQRATQAAEWLEFLGGVPVSEIPIWLLFKFKRGI